MSLNFLREATEEFFEVIGYYEAQQEGLGSRFRQEVLNVCQSVSRQPLLWRERAGGYRRVNCPVFPYYIAYVVRGDRILVIAVAHGHRRPNYWKKRVS